jgi:hypothetical protein
VGNIHLKPAYSSSIRAGYGYNSRYYLYLGYSRERNSIFPHQPVMRPGRPELIHMVQNFDQVEVLSLELNLPLTLTPWWEVQNNLSGFVRTARTRFDIAPFYQRMVIGNVNSVHSFRLGSGWTAELNILYQSIIPFGVMNLRSMTNIMAGIQKVLPHNRGQVNFTINDLLWTNQLRWYAFFPKQQMDFRATLRDEPRIVKLTYTRSLGSKTLKKGSGRQGAEEEKKRVSF